MSENRLRDRTFEDFFRFEYPRLVAALRLVTGDDDGARDAVDEACARACERLARGRSIDALGAWIRVVAFNVARDKRRRRQSERATRNRLERRVEVHRDISHDVATTIDVEAALARLTRREREVVVLFYFLDRSIDEVATDLVIPAGTVKAALHRARLALASRLDDGTHPPRKVGHA